MSESDALMGELRSLFAQKPGKATWLAICETLDRWPADELARRDEEALPYCQGHMLTWSGRLGTAPPSAWLRRWAKGDPTVVELMGLCYLSSAKAEGASSGELRRCSYYTITSQQVSWVSNNYDAADVHDATHHTADHAEVVRAAHASVEAIEQGVSKLCEHLSTSYNEVAADTLRVAFMLNGVEVYRSLLMPDLTVGAGDETLRLVLVRPAALEHLMANPKKRWPQALKQAGVRLLNPSGEQRWYGELRYLGRSAPWGAAIGGRFRPDRLALSVDVAPLLGELPVLPTFNRLSEAKLVEKTWRFGY